jgi:hypothetical protein
LTPGLATARLLHIPWTIIVVSVHFVLVSLFQVQPSVWQAYLLAFWSLCTPMPLEVITTRLSIQRNYSVNSTGENGIGADVKDEIVIGRNKELYAGFVDCGKRMIHEEGFRSLYRSWLSIIIGFLVGIG